MNKNIEAALARLDRERIAPKGMIWVCGACGKSHPDRYGIEGKGSYGWDESCAINAVLRPIADPGK